MKIEELAKARQLIVNELNASGSGAGDTTLRRLNIRLCDAMMHLFEETGRNDESVEALNQLLKKDFETLEGMTEDHKNILKWHHQALHSVTMQAKLLEMIALGVSLIYELLYFY